jgi:undecaprenyl pyrophosphate phosphatase UppP
VVAEKLLGLDPSSPPMTLLLVMLHTGTMFAVIVYFWKQWRDTYFQGASSFKGFAGILVLATALTGLIGESAAASTLAGGIREFNAAEEFCGRLCTYTILGYIIF